MAYVSGTEGSVKIGSTAYAFGKWKAQMKMILPKVTNFTSSGAQELLSGVKSATITLSGPYNSGAMAFTVGTSYTWLLNFTDAIGLSITARIESIEPDNDVEGNPIINITAQSTGTFTAAIA